MGIRFDVASDAVEPLDRSGKERHCLVDAFVGLGATEPQEAVAGLAEAFAAQAGHAESIVGRFKQIKCQAVRRDAQPVADRADVGKDVEGAGRAERRESRRCATGPTDIFSTLRETGPCSRRESAASCSRAAWAASWASGGLHEAVVLISLPIDVDDLGARPPRSRSASRSCCTTC